MKKIFLEKIVDKGANKLCPVLAFQLKQPSKLK